MRPRIILLLIFPLLYSCEPVEYQNNQEYLLGVWKVDSTNQVRPKQWHAGVQFFEFLDSSNYKVHFYHESRNQTYSTKYSGYFVSDSTFSYDSSSIPSKLPFWELYAFKKLNNNRFTIIAQFPTSWSFPNQDSVLYFSRVKNLQRELSALEKSGNPREVTFGNVDTAYLKGFWKIDSTVKTRSTWEENNKYLYFDGEGKIIGFWLGKNADVNFIDYQLQADNKIKIAKGYGVLVCLDSSKLVIEGKSKIKYKAQYFTRMDFETVLPDSFKTYITNNAP